MIAVEVVDFIWVGCYTRLDQGSSEEGKAVRFGPLLTGARFGRIVYFVSKVTGDSGQGDR